MMKNLLTPLKALSLVVVFVGMTLITSCGSDDPSCDEKTWYADADGDGLGDPNTTKMACDQPAGYVSNSDDNDDTVAKTDATMNMWELIQATDGLDSLEKYLGNYPDLKGLLQTDGTFTLFAPDNDAFISLLTTPGFPSKIDLINPDIIKNVLSYHIASQVYTKADLTAGTKVTTLATGQGSDVDGNDKIVVNSDGTLLTGSSNAAIEITTADVAATNGEMQIVGSVLIPQTVGAQLTPILGTNAGTLLLGASFSELAKAILKADTFATANSLPTLYSILSGDTEYTVFAPTNQTFEAGSITMASYTGQQWYGIISNHVTAGSVAGDQLTAGKSFQSLYTTDGTTFGHITVLLNDPSKAQNGVGIFLDGNGDTTPDAEVVLPDASVNPNGRVHVIARVLAPM